MTKTQKLIDLDKKHGAQHYQPLPVVLKKGDGVWVYDVEGKRYLDMMSAYSAVNLGHCHPRIVDVVKSQADKLMLCSRAFHSDKMIPLLEKISHMTGLEKVLMMNTGAEAVETALKAARRWGYQVKGIPENKAEIIVADNNFHGRTITIISLSTDTEYQKGFGPLTPGFKTVKFADIDDLKKAITPNTCAVLFEPMQGEGGMVIPDDSWLKEVRLVCDNKNTLLILDEIQTGLGRTGKFMASEWSSVKPDAMILGKALGGGAYPVSAFVANSEVMDVFDAGSHGSTFSGNPLGSAVALEALDLINDPQLLAHVRKMGDILMNELKSFAHPAIREVRGKGLFVGIELIPGAIEPKEILKNLMKNGVLTKDTYCRTTDADVIRLAPPLTITEDELQIGLSAIKLAFKESTK